MRFATASLIIAYVATLAVAAPTSESASGLNLRSVEVGDVARAVVDVELQERAAKK